MRVLCVTHQYRPAIGGAEQYITDLAEELVRRGHRIDVFTSRAVDYRTWRNELPAYETLDGVQVHRFRSLPRTALTWRLLSYGYYHHWRTGHACYEPFVFIGNGPVCPAMLPTLLTQAHQYDLVHINNLHYSHALTAYAAARRRGLPIVITPHIHAEQRETYDVGYMRRILRGCDAVLADTQAERQYLLEQHLNPEVLLGGVGLRLERFPPLERAACRARFGLPENAFVVLFLGRKTEYKGLNICLEAFSLLRQRHPDAHLLAIGPETSYSQALWTRYAGLDGLTVRGEVSDEERLAALAACDVLALPSVGEAFGIVYLEAWAYGKPVIGARIASVSSLIADGKDGRLVEPQHAGPLLEALEEFAAQPETAQAMGQRGRAKLEQRYTVPHIADIVEAAYVRVLRRRRTKLG